MGLAVAPQLLYACRWAGTLGVERAASLAGPQSVPLRLLGRPVKAHILSQRMPPRAGRPAEDPSRDHAEIEFPVAAAVAPLHRIPELIFIHFCLHDPRLPHLPAPFHPLLALEFR